MSSRKFAVNTFSTANQMNGLILAAGFGRRLKPITDIIPKPLLPIVDRPIVEINVQRLKAVGINKIGINLFYQAAAIKKFLSGWDEQLSIMVEDKLLGTGGAFLNFRHLLKGDFIVHNCDVFSTINLEAAIKYHEVHKPIATLLLTKNRGTDFIRINKKLEVVKICKKSNKNYYTYTGIAIISDRIFDYFPKQEVFSIIDVFQKIIDRGRPIIGIPTKEVWYDIGNPRSYWQLHYDILNQELKGGGSKWPAHTSVHASSVVRTRKLNGFVSIGANCYIGKAVSLKNVVVVAKSRIEDGAFEDCILANKFCIQIK